MAKGANHIQKTLRCSAVSLRYGNKGMSLLQMPVVYVVGENPSFPSPLLPPSCRGPLPKKCQWSLPKNHRLLLQHAKLLHVNVHALSKNLPHSARTSILGRTTGAGDVNGTPPTPRPVVVGLRDGNEKELMPPMLVVCAVVAELQSLLIGQNPLSPHHSVHFRHSLHSPPRLLLLPLQHVKDLRKNVAVLHKCFISNAKMTRIGLEATDVPANGTDKTLRPVAAGPRHGNKMECLHQSPVVCAVVDELHLTRIGLRPLWPPWLLPCLRSHHLHQALP